MAWPRPERHVMRLSDGRVDEGKRIRARRRHREDAAVGRQPEEAGPDEIGYGELIVAS